MKSLYPTLVLLALLGGCALGSGNTKDRAIARSSSGNAEHCAAAPSSEATSFRNLRSRVYARLGRPQHRGTDLIAVESDENQTIVGKLAYTPVDKDLEGEDVLVFACVDASWIALGATRTGGDGRFQLSLADTKRLPAGMRDLYAHVAGDGSGVRFLAYVARVGESVIVTDVDGTITASETAVYRTVMGGSDIGHRPGAPQALAHSGRTVVYVTSRGDLFTDLTRQWLREHGFPPGPLRLAPTTLTRPGSRTIEYKTRTLRALRVPIHAGIGNKPTDVRAYENAGVHASRIFIKLPEFESDVREALLAQRAVGFKDYAALAPVLR